LLAGSDAVYLVIAAVLAPFGAWLALGRRADAPKPNDRRITPSPLIGGI
jgi:hypothetical protein